MTDRPRVATPPNDLLQIAGWVALEAAVALAARVLVTHYPPRESCPSSQ